VFNVSHIFGEGDKYSHIFHIVVKHPKVSLINLYVSELAMQEVVQHVVEWVVLKSFVGPRTLG
jgi:lipid A disaccharide synthetase